LFSIGQEKAKKRWLRIIVNLGSKIRENPLKLMLQAAAVTLPGDVEYPIHATPPPARQRGYDVTSPNPMVGRGTGERRKAHQRGGHRRAEEF
jgi:hypothetical protein